MRSTLFAMSDPYIIAYNISVTNAVDRHILINTIPCSNKTFQALLMIRREFAPLQVQKSEQYSNDTDVSVSLQM